ncbi:MAG: hypothetical protein ACRDXX_14050 [Stackebrandtia sp.]
MTDRRPYDPEPRRRPGPGRPEPTPRGRHSRDVPTAGRGEPPPEPSRRGNDFEPSTGAWDQDESTRMIGKLGYVPPEARHESLDDGFDDGPGGRSEWSGDDGPGRGRGEWPSDPDRLTSADKSKYRARKRARKKSPWAVLGVLVLVIAVVGGLVVGGMWLFSRGGDDDSGSGLKYEALDKPCEPLDPAVVEDVAGELSELTNEADHKSNKSEQTCEVANDVAGEGGVGVNVRVTAEVYDLEARAPKSYSRDKEAFEADEESPDVFAEVDGVGEAAFSLTRMAEDDSSSSYQLHLYDGNAYVTTTVSVYGEDVSSVDVKSYAHEVAKTYLDNWS